VSELLKADGSTINKPYCIAKDCKDEKVDPKNGKFFCSRHELNVPRHLKKALVGEVLWCQHKNVQMDQHTMALLTVAANREYATRIIKDPAEMAKWKEEERLLAIRAKAEQAGLLLPPSRPQEAPAASIPKPPPTSIPGGGMKMTP